MIVRLPSLELRGWISELSLPYAIKCLGYKSSM